MPVMISGDARDTDPRIAAMQIALLRGASTAARVRRARSLSQTTMELARRAIRRARPSASEQDLRLAFVSLHYGPQLAERLRERISAR